MHTDCLQRCGIYPALENAGIHEACDGMSRFPVPGRVVFIHKETGSLKLAQEQLGHSDVSTMGNIYAHVDDQEMDKAASILGMFSGILW